MSAFLIISGFTLAFSGMIFGPYMFHKHIKNHYDAKAVGLLSMLPGIFLFCLGFYLR